MSAAVGSYLPDGYTCHKLRARFATRVYKATGDLFATQQLLGHSDLATTQVYVAVDVDQLRAVAATAQGRS